MYRQEGNSILKERLFMMRANFSCAAYSETSVRLDILSLLDTSELVEHLAYGVNPGRVPVVSLMSFMSFWDRFRRKPKKEEGEHSEEEEPKKKRWSWRGFHSGQCTGRIVSFLPLKSMPGWSNTSSPPTLQPTTSKKHQAL